MIGLVKIDGEKYIGEIKQTDNRGQTIIEIKNPEKVNFQPNGVAGKEKLAIPKGYEATSIRIYKPDYLIYLDKKRK